MSEIEFNPDPSQELVRLEVDRANMDIEFYELPKIKPLEVNFENGATVEFRPDNCYIVLYKYAPEYNHIQLLDENGEQQTIYNTPDLTAWLASFSFEDSKMKPSLHHGQDIHDICGWTADVLIKDLPDPDDKAQYELSQCYDLYPLGQLTVDSVLAQWAEEEAEEEEDES